MFNYFFYDLTPIHFFFYIYHVAEALKFIKKMTWTKIPDKISKEVRSIMTAHYKETLEKIADLADDDVNADLEQNLRRTARSINQNVKTLMVPDTMDTKLLDPSTFTLRVTGKKKSLLFLLANFFCL